MLKVVEQAFRTDTGRQRDANEDSYFARSPVFAVADGMGGAQAGEVASRLAAESFEAVQRGEESPEAYLRSIAKTANARIHQLAESDSTRSGMGTTFTAALVEGEEVGFAHVGDSRAYLFRNDELPGRHDPTNFQKAIERGYQWGEEIPIGLIWKRTDLPALEDLEPVLHDGNGPLGHRKLGLTDEQAEDHPQRSIITRALGPERDVEVDTMTYRARPGDVYLLCSDGLTTMIKEDRIAEILREAPTLDEAADRLVAEANEAGGRDNITVVAFRVDTEEVAAERPEDLTLVGPAAEEEGLTAAGVAAEAERQRAETPERARVRAGAPARGERRWPRRTVTAVVTLVVIAGLAIYGFYVSRAGKPLLAALLPEG